MPTKVAAEVARARVEAKFRRVAEEQAAAALVMADVAKAREAERLKTERLRAMRIAKQEADRIAAADRQLLSPKRA